jgi:uncharacterized repeat protein (TIGR01451 family)
MEERENRPLRRGIAVVALAGVLTTLALFALPHASAATGPTDLSLTKTDSADPVTVGDTFSYVLTVRNLGAMDAASVTVTDNLPGKISYVSATPSSGSCQKSGRKVTCDLGQVNAGGSATVTITVKATKSGTVSNTASLTSADDTNAANNVATQSTVINKKPSPKKLPASCAAPTIVGTSGPDVLQGTNHADVIAGLGGNDQIFGNRGNDLICAGLGADFVDGGPGKDTIIGGRGPDRLFGGDGADTIKGKNGRDKLFGQGGDDLLNGGAGRDKCKGGPGTNTILNCP